MTGMDGHGLGDLDSVRDYLKHVGAESLLKYVREVNGRYELVSTEYEQIRRSSVRYQVACIFTILGEYTIANDVYRVTWSDLSSWGDKIGNGLLKQFMRSYP